jgi:hypothetical protein
MQATKQKPEQKPRGNPSWIPGVSQNPAGKESKAARRARIERIVSDWCEPAGGTKAFNPAELALLARAAEMTLVLPRNPEDQVRVLNSIRGVLKQLGLVQHRRREPSGPSLREYLTSEAARANEGASTP